MFCCEIEVQCFGRDMHVVGDDLCIDVWCIECRIHQSWCVVAKWVYCVE